MTLATRRAGAPSYQSARAAPPCSLLAALLLVLFTALLAAQIAAAANACRISEYPCRSGRCVRLDRYCDGNDDCGDGSDEPRFCTVCNRTYYGDVGKTYEMKLGKPIDGRLPFLCHLTFTANGHIHGDIVQLIFDAFNVGRYEPSALDGCPDGYMQLSELGRPFTGGSWCGSSSGYAVYYSETSTITVSVKLFHARPNAPFDFKLRYKFVSQGDAIVRFGAPSAPLERGQVSPGTYCTRNYEECYRKPCRLQSPNYPGMYPRNVTCYWSLRQKTVPTCKHAMIAVRQEAEHKMQMKRSISMASINKTGRALKAWKECTGERDHLIFYDGGSTNDPVLVKYCGGDWLPKVVSRGPEMLVAFHSSPFSIPLHSAGATSPLRGFELDVDIIFADSDSLDYSREARRCEFHVHASSGVTNTAVSSANAVTTIPEDATRGRRGRLLSPRHTLPPNTTCEWTFHGRPGDLVWIYFVSYFHHPLFTPPEKDSENVPPPPPGPPSVLGAGVSTGRGRGGFRSGNLEYGRQQELPRERLGKQNNSTGCSTRLRIWDGGGPDDAKVLADHCDNDGPRLCDHTSLSNLTRVTRPCTPQESYISTGSKMVLHHHTAEGTALHPATFRLRYEFVDTRLGGEVWAGAIAAGGILQEAGAEIGLQGPWGNCARIFKKIKEAEFGSPRNVFMYGRGGATNMSCAYRIEAGPGERVRLSIRNVSLGSSSTCGTESDIHTGRPKCSYQTKNKIASLRVYDAPWKDVRIPRACICDNTTSSDPKPLVIQSSSRALELLFSVSSFSITDDYTDIFFYASFEVVPSSDCGRKQRLKGSGGEEDVANPPRNRLESSCAGMPWVVEARDNRSLFLLTWGTLLPLNPSQDEPARCPTKNRLMIYTGRPPRLIKVLCPTEPNTRQYEVQVFSEDWFSHTTQPTTPSIYLTPTKPPSFLVEFVARESGGAGFTWLEISKSRSSLLQQLQVDVVEPIEKLEYSNDSLSAFNSDCTYKCPELNACISSSLWCDGRLNCPSGYDENEMHCGVGRRFFKQFPGGVYTALGCTAAVLAACILFTIFALIARFRRSRDRRLGKKKLLATADGRRLTEELLLDPGSNTNTVSS